MNSRPYLSIGQVLDLLKQEFPDLTISKIRFLESQGLLDPERTPSGYRKFYDPDVDRLRYILRAQQDQYLPLKVIKGRLGDEEGTEPPGARSAAEAAEGGNGAGSVIVVPDQPVAGGEPSSPAARGGVGAAAGPRGALGGMAGAAPALGRAGGALPSGRPGAAGSAPVGRPGGPWPTVASGPGALGGPAGGGAMAGGALPGRPSRDELDLGASRHPSVVGGQPGRAQTGALRPVPEEGADDTSLTLEELATVSGLSTSELSELERFGLLTGRRIAGTTYYDTDCATIAALAARFRSFGVEARHLRMYRTAVEREAGFFEQVVTPMLKQRNPQARRQAVDALLEMSRLGSALREAVLRLALREHTGGLQ